MDVRNRVTRLTFSSSGAGNQPQAQTGEIAQEANAFGKAEGYADVGRVYGKSSATEGCRVLWQASLTY